MSIWKRLFGGGSARANQTPSQSAQSIPAEIEASDRGLQGKNNNHVEHLNEPMLTAARGQEWQEMRRLLDGGADVNARNSKTMTALMYASGWGADDAVSDLLRRGADINAKDKDNMSPIVFAALQGHLTTVRLLMNAGVEDVDRGRALHAAISRNHQDIVGLLSGLHTSQFTIHRV